MRALSVLPIAHLSSTSLPMSEPSPGLRLGARASREVFARFAVRLARLPRFSALFARFDALATAFDDAAAYIADFGARIPGAQPSMLLDHLARRRSEIDAINGMVPVVAAEVGTAAPLNSAIAALVRAREAGFP